MTGMYSLTLVLANATDVSGLPALPFLSAGFLLANGDLLWRRLSRRRTGLLTGRTGALEQRDALDVRRVREHVHRCHAPQLVAVLLAERLHVAGERGRVAGDVDEPRRADAAEPPQRLPRQAGARRIDDDDVGRAGALEQLLDDLADVAREEGRVRDPVELGVLERAGDRLLRDLDPPDRQRVAREREPDRADPAVEIPDRLAAASARAASRASA